MKTDSFSDILYVLQYLAAVCDGEPQPHLYTVTGIDQSETLITPNLPIRRQHDIFHKDLTSSEAAIRNRISEDNQINPVFTWKTIWNPSQTPRVISGMVNFSCFMMARSR